MGLFYTRADTAFQICPTGREPPTAKGRAKGRPTEPLQGKIQALHIHRLYLPEITRQSAHDVILIGTSSITTPPRGTMSRTQSEIDAAASNLMRDPKVKAKLDAYAKQAEDSAKPIHDTTIPAKEQQTGTINSTSTTEQTPELTTGETILVCAFIITAIIASVVVLRIMYNWATAILRGFNKGAASCAEPASKKAGGLKAACFLAMRGKLVVRASTYLMALSRPDTTLEMANTLAASIDFYAAYQLRAAALYHLNDAYNGSRLAMISEARLRGFRG